jgi:type II secretory pathway pseudopilin PulG
VRLGLSALPLALRPVIASRLTGLAALPLGPVIAPWLTGLAGLVLLRLLVIGRGRVLGLLLGRARLGVGLAVIRRRLPALLRRRLLLGRVRRRRRLLLRLALGLARGRSLRLPPGLLRRRGRRLGRGTGGRLAHGLGRLPGWRLARGLGRLPGRRLVRGRGRMRRRRRVRGRRALGLGLLLLLLVVALGASLGGDEHRGGQHQAQQGRLHGKLSPRARAAGAAGNFTRGAWRIATVSVGATISSWHSRVGWATGPVPRWGGPFRFGRRARRGARTAASLQLARRVAPNRGRGGQSSEGPVAWTQTRTPDSGYLRGPNPWTRAARRGGAMPEGPEVETENLRETIHEELEKEEKGGLIRIIALTTAILAALAALASLRAGATVNEALVLKTEATRLQAEASDQWAYYQAKGLKAAVQEAIKATWQVSGKAEPKEVGDKAERYKAEQEAISEKAKEKEKERDAKEAEATHLLHAHHRFAAAVALFQVSIALGAVAALTRLKLVWLGSLALGAGGLISLVLAMTH